MLDEEKILAIIQEDLWMMGILKTAKALNLPDWWICAGFVRSKIWDTLHGFNIRTEIEDVDVIYFDPSNLDEAKEKAYEETLKSYSPSIPWSVKNEARMHLRNNCEPYQSSADAISKFPETATALGVKLDAEDNLILTAPCGIYDVVNMIVQPTPFILVDKKRAFIYEERVAKKNWKATWGQIEIKHITNKGDVFNGKI
ncbi:nucleotidyltransferase family protein [Ureibacillus chungkukjangi]|uniref:nucleotidyltransferase family protein n=1 Tax=Ureibacillus chungkukjangi TaxID=1202712 RepID=UPI0020420361|nr:nucleotidyltransferase family protein [Ureibacillus chungkukjangi]MCM3388864.1 nucleotidyltransferase family protein [Ureibacillus chungkukjangi]